MNQDKEQWFENILSSMQGSKKAQPSADLFAKITEEICSTKTVVFPMHTIKRFAAAAALLVLVNASAILYCYNTNLSESENGVANSNSDKLISTFLIYE